MTAWPVVLPVFVLVARTFSPTFSLLMATSAPDAVRTLVVAVKDMPPQEAARRSSAAKPPLYFLSIYFDIRFIHGSIVARSRGSK